MTDDDLNRALAEALFPGFDLNGWYTDGVLSQQAASIAGCYRPRDFCRDGNAMLALIAAVVSRGWWWSANHSHWTFEKEGEGGRAGRALLSADTSEIPRYVAEAAANALGVWEE